METKSLQQQQSERNLDAKIRLSGKIQRNIDDVASFGKQLLKGAKATEVLIHTLENFAILEHSVANCDASLKKMQLLATHLHLQQEAIEKSAQVIDEVRDHARALVHPRIPSLSSV
ncbi:PREDICTED: uncharacterized protein LOC106816349 [Priapulus caudatus]|uniref:BLOC-1-related complex subunit 7 n=1 Tax=Priapulus caudatus TaxID=37621 RepID=A0ABM1EW42_PRICU|nr:PREDICTED: uncharacterized protein LOC106816349 [Priapulus caudatus]